MSDRVTVEIQRIERVLLADGWHAVKRGSFRVGEFALVGDENTVVGYTAALQHGAQWEEREGSGSGPAAFVTCPLLAILAVQTG